LVEGQFLIGKSGRPYNEYLVLEQRLSLDLWRRHVSANEAKLGMMSAE